MRIERYLYRLHFRGNYGTIGKGLYRDGALLRTTFEDGIVGYSDCHPWEELGDLPLSEQLLALSSQEKTPLLECSMKFARLDAEARKQNRSLFEGLQIPASHQIVSCSDVLDDYIASGITCFKLKTGSENQKEISALLRWKQTFPNIKFRLDFNEKLSRENFLKYWDLIPEEVKKNIEFLEDPYPYEASSWTQDQKDLQVAFAADKHFTLALHDRTAAKYLICKPAVDKCEQLPKQAQLVVTTYLDHPFGQMCAAYTAARLKAEYPDQIKDCGLLSHVCYEKDAFVEAIRTNGPNLLPAQGTGFGFDNLLEKLPWTK